MNTATLNRLCELSNLTLAPEETKTLLEDIQLLLDKFSLLESLPEASIMAKDRRMYFRPDVCENITWDEMDIAPMHFFPSIEAEKEHGH
jgi:Asp-tRNA(Asn)/Glu-tRNA(Gln) amidotransferase C subunit